MGNFESAWEKFCAVTRDAGIKNLLLYQDGEVCGELHYDQNCLRNAYSATKSFTATAVGIAQEEGLLSVEEKVIKCFPKEIPQNLPEHLEHLKIKHLLSMTVGQDASYLMGPMRPKMQTQDWVSFVLNQPFLYEPGTVFQYTNVGPYLCGILVARRAGQSLASYLYERLFEPLGFFYPSWEVDPQGNAFGAGGLMVTVEHLLRFGQVYLQNGEWEGRQLIPESWVREVQTPSLLNGDKAGQYGYGFWLGPDKSYAATGKYGQRAVIMPSKHAVLAITAESADPKEKIMRPFWDILYPEI